MKRVISLLVTLAMLFTLFTIPVSADNSVGTKEPLLMQAKMSGSWCVKLSWSKYEGADKYMVYGNISGRSFKKITTTKKTSITISRIKGTCLQAHMVYKFRVSAYKKGKRTATSKNIYFIVSTTKGKYANVKTIKAKQSNITMSVGEKKKLSATYKMYSGKKHLPKSYGKALRYYSNNKDVVAVDGNGNVTALSGGNATIYIQDIGGKYTKTNITVAESTCLLSFNANGGSGEMQGQTLAAGEQSIINENTFKRDGYQFKYWSTSPDGQGVPYIDKGIILLNENLTLYAQWEKDEPQVISGGGGGGTAPAPSKETYFVMFDYMGKGTNSLINIQSGAKLPSLPSTSHEGYTFLGWYKDAGLTNIWDINTPVTENIILYAKFEPKTYDVTFVSEGKAVASIKQTYKSKYVLPIEPKKEGFTFIGWYTKETSGEEVTESTTVNITSPMTLYARYTQGTYKITYYDQGQNKFTGIHEAGYPTNYTYGVQTLLKTANKTSYYFEGWYLDKACTGERVTYIKEDATGDITLYAKWRRPKTGDLITLDNQSDIYRVIDSNEEKVRVVSTKAVGPAPYGGWITPWLFEAEHMEGGGVNFSGSRLDGYLNGDYYQTLSRNIKEAIIPQLVTQTLYEKNYVEDCDRTGEDYLFDTGGSYIKFSQKGKTVVGQKNISMLSLDDIFAYYGKKVVMGSELKELFYDSSVERIWLLTDDALAESNSYIIDIHAGTIQSMNAEDSGMNECMVNPAFTVDITKCTWSLIKPNNAPTKNEIITIQGLSGKFKVLSIKDGIAKVLSMQGSSMAYYSGNAKTETYQDQNEYISYIGSDIDNSLTEYYNNLPDNIKKAIVSENIGLKAYQSNYPTYWDTDPTFQEEFSPNQSCAQLKSELNPVQRYVYAPSVKDIHDILGEITSNELMLLFFDKGDSSDSSIWLRDAASQNTCWTVQSGGSLDTTYVDDALQVRMVFSINLNICQWEKAF